MVTENDFYGWGLTKWGMTEDEVIQLLKPDARKIFPPIEYRNPQRFSTVGILDKNIGGLSCNIHFLFDENGGLNEVMIKPTDEKPVGYFESLFKFLRQKYGEPTEIIKEEDSCLEDNVLWRFPSTVVELTRLDAYILEILMVTVRYYPALPSDDFSFL